MTLDPEKYGSSGGFSDVRYFYPSVTFSSASEKFPETSSPHDENPCQKSPPKSLPNSDLVTIFWMGAWDRRLLQSEWIVCKGKGVLDIFSGLEIKPRMHFLGPKNRKCAGKKVWSPRSKSF